MSDLHLEIGKHYSKEPYSTFDLPVTAPFLILAGDIGLLKEYDDYVEFLHHQTTRYRRIFLILGNHEFYDLSYHKGVNIAENMMLEPSLGRKVTLLYRKRYDMRDDSGISILGCTLWSHIPAEDSHAISSALSDYRRIHNWSVDEHNQAHSTDLSWLKGQVHDIQQTTTDESPPRSVIVIYSPRTHDCWVNESPIRRQPKTHCACNRYLHKGVLVSCEGLGIWTYALDDGFEGEWDSGGG